MSTARTADHEDKNLPAKAAFEVLSGVLTKEEIEGLTRRSDLAGALAVASTWLVIVATFALLAWLPHPVTFVLAVVVLGTRQLALVVLMHEAAHGTLFKTRWYNDVLTDWVCARPVWTDVARYRVHHVKHHAHAGSASDPDRSLVDPFPISRRSLARKLARDVFFVSGIKRFIGLFMMDAGLLSYTVALDPKRLPYRRFGLHARAFIKNAGGFLLTNLLMTLALFALGHAWVMLAWLAALLTTFGLFLRIRSMAEHACMDGEDPLRSTRTTHAGLLARLTVAPFHVGFHLEHHLHMRVPFFRLREMHQLLGDRGALPRSSVASSYAEVLRIVTTVRPATPTS